MDRSEILLANDFLTKKNAELTFQRDQAWALVTAIRSAMDEYDGSLKKVGAAADVAAAIAIERIEDAFATHRGMATSSPSAPGPYPRPELAKLTAELDDLRSKITNAANAFNELFYPGNMTGGGAWRAGGNFEERASDRTGFGNT